MKLGCAAYSYRDALQSGAMTLEGFVDECARLGFEGVELTAYYFPSTDRPALHTLKRYCYLRGLDICGTAVGSNFTQPDAERRAQQVQMTKDWIDHSVELGAPGIRVFAGPVPEGVSERDAMTWAVECLRECAAYGAERGVVVALENHGGVTARAEQVLEIAAPLESPWFGINLDCGNFREDPYDEIRRVARLAVTAHAKVTTRTPDGVEPVDYARVGGILEEAGYRGYLNVEYEEKEDAMLGVPRFAEYLQSVFRPS
jgi:sugar phosphate isomerase/epimerase